ncbi:hypothetical protein JCM3775_003711 [Rhodotorula graminis]
MSPWTGVGSPGSSDFETISDAEVPPPSNAPHVPAQQSNLARSLSRRHPRASSTVDLDGSIDAAAAAAAASAGRAASSIERSDDDHLRAIEGDDEDSSALEDVDRDEGGRGRARTRRMPRDPELQRSMLEDALRSSLATLLSLAPAQATMSQSPALSHVSLASLFQPIGAAASSSSSATASRTSLDTRAPHNAKRPSPFSTSLFDPLGEEDNDDDDEQGLGDNVLVSSSSPQSSSSDEGEGTQLAPTVAYRSRAIPIVSTPARVSEPSTSAAAASFSPLVASRPLGAAPGQPSSNSPPYYSRSRRGAAPVRRRGRGRGGSASPGPASVEERRRARERAVEEGVGPAVTSDGGGQRDEAFQDMVDAARFFSDLSPRASLRAPYSSLPSSYETARPRHPPTTTATSSWAPDTASSATSTPPYYSGDEDPALASESPPRLDLSSSGAEGDGERAMLPHASQGEKAPDRAAKGVGPARDEADEAAPKKQGWFGWWRAFGTTVELKVWHLVGICGVLIGVGLGASSLIHTLAPSSWLASRLDFAHRVYASPFLAPSAPPAALVSAAQSERSSPSSSSAMSSLFL